MIGACGKLVAAVALNLLNTSYGLETSRENRMRVEDSIQHLRTVEEEGSRKQTPDVGSRANSEGR